jgi:hypothetical protein
VGVRGRKVERERGERKRVGEREREREREREEMSFIPQPCSRKRDTNLELKKL